MKAQRIHLLLVEDDDLDVMNVHRALASASLGAAGYFVKPAAQGRFRQIIDALRGYWSAVEFPSLDAAKA